jgi:lipid A 4'-phosphatase
MKKGIFIDFALPLMGIIFLTAALGVANADIKIEEYFYSPDGGWFLGQSEPWSFLYHFGNIPAFLLSAAGLFSFLLSFFRRTFLPYRKIGLFLVIFMILGPGLLVNTVFKDHWGRPRPADIVQFGGSERFHHFWEMGRPGQGKSFPSGHASVGFFLFAPFFVLRNNHRKWALSFLFLGISYGMLMGLGRMVQGGHFLTDVLWAGAITYLTGLVLYYIFRFDSCHPRAGGDPG